MNRRAAYLLIPVAVLLIALVTLAIGLRDDEEEPDGNDIEIAGMQMSPKQIDEMVRDSMDVAAMDELDLVTPGDRAQLLEPTRSASGVVEFALSARPLRWEYRDRQSVAAWGYEGQVPGPAIVVTEGDRVKVTFTNGLPEATTVHWHGVDLPWTQDGVPGVTQEAIEPGASFSYEFVAKPAGTRFYHTHGSGPRDEARQLDMGLSGALIIKPRGETPADVDETLVLDEWQVEPGGYNAAMMSGAGHAAHAAGFNVFTINGRSAPDSAPLHVERGQRVRLRLINAGSSTTHPMHLHGHNFQVTAIDGNPVPLVARQRRNVVVLNPGETYDVEFTADNPGVWMLHCHELHHADAGMMTLLQYEGFEPVGDEHASDADADEEPH